MDPFIYTLVFIWSNLQFPKLPTSINIVYSFSLFYGNIFYNDIVHYSFVLKTHSCYYNNQKLLNFVKKKNKLLITFKELTMAIHCFILSLRELFIYSSLMKIHRLMFNTPAAKWLD